MRTTLTRLRSGGARLPAPPQPVGAEAARLARATMRTLPWLPGDTRCLTQSLVLTRLLIRRGIPSTLVIGVAPGRSFGAHAWIELAGHRLLPADEEEFGRLVEL